MEDQNATPEAKVQPEATRGRIRSITDAAQAVAGFFSAKLDNFELNRATGAVGSLGQKGLEKLTKRDPRLVTREDLERQASDAEKQRKVFEQQVQDHQAAWAWVCRKHGYTDVQRLEFIAQQEALLLENLEQVRGFTKFKKLEPLAAKAE